MPNARVEECTILHANDIAYIPAEVATGTKADAVDAKRAKIARIRAIILIVLVVCCYVRG